MRRGKRTPHPNAPFRRARWSLTWTLGILGAAFYFLGGQSSVYLLAAAALVPALALGQALLLRRVVLRQSISGQTTRRGDCEELTLELSNRCPLPTPYACWRMRDSRNLLHFEAEAPLGLLPFQRAVRKYPVLFRHRGVYDIGAEAAAAADSFMLFRMRLKPPPPLTVRVYPRVMELGRFAPSRLPEETNVGLSLLLAEEASADTRKYIPGDRLARIHWSQSARQGELMTRLSEPETDAHILILLDTRPPEGNAPLEAEDALLEACFSLTRHLQMTGHRLVFACLREGELYHTLVSGPEDFQGLFAACALMRFNADIPVGQVMERLETYRYTVVFTAHSIRDSVSERQAADQPVDILYLGPPDKLPEDGSLRPMPNRRVITLDPVGDFIAEMEAVE